MICMRCLLDAVIMNRVWPRRVDPFSGAAINQPRRSTMKLRIFPSAAVILSLLAFASGCLKKESAEVVANDETDSAIAMQPVPRETTDLFAPGEDDPDEDGVSEAP